MKEGRQLLEFRSEYDFYDWANGKEGIAYIRVSSDEQKKKQTVDIQRRKQETFYVEKKATLKIGYVDVDKTATTIRGRKIINIIQDFKDDLADFVTFTKWDRAFRNVRDQENFIYEIKKLGKVAWAIEDSNDDMMRIFYGAFAQKESQKIGIRTVDGFVEKAEKGIFVSRLKGYKKYRTKKTNILKVKIDPVDGPRIQEAIKMYLEGASLNQVEKKTTICKWTFESILNNQAYTSFINYRGRKFPISFEPLFLEKSRLEGLLKLWERKIFKKGVLDSEFQKLKENKLKIFNQQLKDLAVDNS